MYDGLDSEMQLGYDESVDNDQSGINISDQRETPAMPWEWAV